MSPSDAKSPMPRSRPSKILLVDDEPSVREMVGRVLIDAGYLVLSAADGLEAIEIAKANAPDLVILDLQMPRKSGWDTFEELTRQAPLTPIIIVTARPNQLFTSLGAGVGALLEKPFEIPTLLVEIERLLAEPAETRLARLAGQETAFRYTSAKE